MPDDCGLKPPIEALPQIAHERAMTSSEQDQNRGRAREGPERGGIIARGLRPAVPGRQTRRFREEDVARVPTDPSPGRAVVTRHAIADIVRAATLASYGVTGFAAHPLARLAGALGLAQPGLRLDLATGLAIDLRLTVAYGLPIAEVARQVDSAVRHAIRRSLGREVDRLTIHVGGLRYQPGGPPPATSPADPPAVALADLAESGTDVA
jgi:uncharacterized alkaline shock family protein YloU